MNQWKSDPTLQTARGTQYELLFFAAAHQEWLGRSFDAKIWDAEYDRPDEGEGVSETTGSAGRYTTRPVSMTKVVLLQEHMTAADVACLCEPGVGLLVRAAKLRLRNSKSVSGMK